MQRLAESVFTFQEKVDDLLAIVEQISLEVKSLEHCSYSVSVFSEILAKIQKAVDDLSLHQYSNLPHWVAILDQEVGRVCVLCRFGAGINSGIAYRIWNVQAIILLTAILSEQLSLCMFCNLLAFAIREFINFISTCVLEY